MDKVTPRKAGEDNSLSLVHLWTIPLLGIPDFLSLLQDLPQPSALHPFVYVNHSAPVT